MSVILVKRVIFVIMVTLVLFISNISNTDNTGNEGDIGTTYDFSNIGIIVDNGNVRI